MIPKGQQTPLLVAWMVGAALGAVSVLFFPQAASCASSPNDTLLLSVRQAVAMALERNEDVKLALSKFDKAKGKKKEAYAGALPSLNFLGAYTRNIQRPVIFFPNPDTDETMKIEIGEKNDFLATLSFLQPLYAFGRIGGAIRIADYYMKSSEREVADARQRVALEVEEAYYRTLLAREAAEISRQALEQALARRRETLKKFGQNVASPFDTLRAYVEVKNREPQVVEAENASRIALLNLKRVVGISREQPVFLTDELVYRPQRFDLDEALGEALSARPDLAAMRLQLAMAEKVYQVRKRGNFPFLSLVGSYLVEGQESDRFFPRSERVAHSFSVGLSLSFPVFDGFANRGKIMQAKADLDAARYTLAKAERAVELQVTQLLRELEAAERNLKGREATVAMAEEAYRLALVRYRNGLSTALELGDAELALTQARLNRLQAVYNCTVTRERLRGAMGLLGRQ